MNVKFGIFADLHIDIMHDAEDRLKVFLDACREENVDFVVHLGDYVYPDEDRKCVCKPENTPANVQNSLMRKTPINKEKILNMYKNFEKPSYHSIGNHECDMCSKKQILEYWGEKNAYYSFDMGGVHFVVLDPNYGKVDGKFVSYENGNYFDWPDCIPYLPDEQIEWLRDDLEGTKYPSVLFSHQRLIDGYASIKNAEALRKVLVNAPNHVILAVNGHEHRDVLEEKDGIYFLNHNSISSMWLGTRFEYMGRYGAEIDENFPDMRYVVPYKDPVFSIITISDKSIAIRGRKSEFVGPAPEEIGVYAPDSGFVKRNIHITPHIEDRVLPLKF